MNWFMRRYHVEKTCDSFRGKPLSINEGQGWQTFENSLNFLKIEAEGFVLFLRYLKIFLGPLSVHLHTGTVSECRYFCIQNARSSLNAKSCTWNLNLTVEHKMEQQVLVTITASFAYKKLHNYCKFSAFPFQIFIYFFCTENLHLVVMDLIGPPGALLVPFDSWPKRRGKSGFFFSRKRKTPNKAPSSIHCCW